MYTQQIVMALLSNRQQYNYSKIVESYIINKNFIKHLDSQNISSTYKQSPNCIKLHKNCHQILQMLLLQIMVHQMYDTIEYIDPLREVYQMNVYDQILSKISALFISQCPLPDYRMVFKRFDFQNKGIFAALSLLESQKLTHQQQKLAVKFLTALQLVNLGFSLHHSVGKSQKLNFLTRAVLKMMSKQMKDSYLVLGGDYFHIKGSLLASQTNNIKLSKLLSQVQINLCKYVHQAEKLKTKILTEGYDAVNIRQIYNISVLKTSPIVKGLISIDLIRGKSQEQIQVNKQTYQIIGLLMQYRKDLQNFMFNFKDIVKKYVQYKQNRINFDSQQSLPYYIFYQGAKDNKRIDTSYLNTVTMMSEQIKYLEKKLVSILGEKKTYLLLQKMNYFLMIYS